MVKMIRDNTGRFAERPFYEARDLDNECERLIRDLLLKRRGTVDYPVATDDLTVLIEMHDADLDPYADLSAYGADVEGVTEFFPDRGPQGLHLGTHRGRRTARESLPHHAHP